MNFLKISLGIFLALAASRFIPHPPNFTSLLALSFYVPALLGKKYIPSLIVSFAITDIFIGFHTLTLFTWGSVFLIGIVSKYFVENFNKRIIGSFFGAVIFFIITNFGVWSLGSYGYTLNGIAVCYTLALPFFAYNIISTLLFSIIIETLLKIRFFKIFYNIVK